MAALHLQSSPSVNSTQVYLIGGTCCLDQGEDWDVQQGKDSWRYQGENWDVSQGVELSEIPGYPIYSVGASGGRCLALLAFYRGEFWSM